MFKNFHEQFDGENNLISFLHLIIIEVIKKEKKESKGSSKVLLYFINKNRAKRMFWLSFFCLLGGIDNLSP